MAKRLYSCIIFFSDRSPVKYRTVSNLYGLWKYCQNRISSNILYFNVYDKKTRLFISQLKSLSHVYDFQSSC